METLKCPSPINIKRKSEDLPCFEEGKRFKVDPGSPKSEPPAPVEFEAINNNYKTLEEEEEESFGSDSEEKEAVETSVTSTSVSATSTSKEEMFQRYQPWLLSAYGDLKKTKTITLKKYDRIVRTLRGLIPNMAENSKFRFWVRTKGFFLGPSNPSGQQDLYVSCSRESGETSYKRVAVVERFFDIIYSIHVELEGRNGRHAGQKKTYRAITESYAFLPREAVTKFLLGCVECQRRSDVDLSTSDKSKTPSTPTPTPTLTPKHSNTETNTNNTLTNTNTDSQNSSPCDQTVPSQTSSSSGNHGSDESSPRPPNLQDCSCDLNKHESESPLYRHSSDESKTSSFHDPSDPKPDLTNDTYNETPKSVPVPINLSMIRRRIPLNLTNLDKDKHFSVIKKSSLSGFSPDIPDIDTNLRLSTSTPDSNKSRSTISSSDSAISKTSESDISPIEPEHFQKPFPKRLYTIHPTTFETIRIPLKHTEISIYYEKNRPYIKPKKRVDSDSPLKGTEERPILSTYLRYMRNLGYSDEDSLRLESEAEIRSTPEPEVVDDHYQGRNGELRLGGEGSPSDDAGIWPYHNSLGGKKPTPPTPRDIPSPVTLQDAASVHDETSSSGNKEDDDDEEEEIDDLKTIPHDPERLKAFNMFVRLFVDENLDRIVPISKQPKEKIQAIIDSCTRQFPEFAERARKRIRTYLKSCRRNKRTRDSAWPESNRPTPAHLTSVQAEQILAQACENESHNAKRMRLGLDPVSQPMPVLPGSETPPSRPAHESFSAANLASSATNQPSDTKPSHQHQHQHPLHLNNNKPDSPNLAKVSEPTPVPAISSITSSPLNGAATSTAPSALFRPNFGPAFQRAAAPQPPFPGTPLFPTPPFGAPGMIHNGPTDLSMKPSKPLLSHKLSPQEMAAVRQLITGYRESAAFLLRSAEELEQLLLQQP